MQSKFCVIKSYVGCDNIVDDWVFNICILADEKSYFMYGTHSFLLLEITQVAKTYIVPFRSQTRNFNAEMTKEAIESVCFFH